MDAHTVYMVEYIADEIKHVEDPFILSVYLRAIANQRCRIGEAKEGSCKGCIYQSHDCREIYRISNDELQIFNNEEEL